MFGNDRPHRLAAVMDAHRIRNLAVVADRAEEVFFRRKVERSRAEGGIKRVV